ncbi:hypothetical protein BCR37DRAFT_16897 [Protomyces lactucae-debilis]|uniref:Uncharacterized protein n=1 Tax=Protomyces lactucae-debilis TaxID=2754530 RepID=A0A1Y2FVA7_PROLT|nr:uncharacterized protein BCR37DRAFT_16897 [Protomyces lactucae-debilis]ORY87928.1 hypothetical protein BCR37DRAFT_16897 [Protomyces lactucae-debilis]
MSPSMDPLNDRFTKPNGSHAAMHDKQPDHNINNTEKRPCTPPAAVRHEPLDFSSPGSSSTGILKSSRFTKRATSVTFSTEDVQRALFPQEHEDCQERQDRDRPGVRFSGCVSDMLSVSATALPQTVDDHHDTKDAPLRWRPRRLSVTSESRQDHTHESDGDAVSSDHRPSPSSSLFSSPRSFNSSPLSRSHHSPRVSFTAALNGASIASPRRVTRFTDLRSPEEKARQERAKLPPADVRAVYSSATPSLRQASRGVGALPVQRASGPSTPSKAPLAHVRSSLLAERSAQPLQEHGSFSEDGLERYSGHSTGVDVWRGQDSEDGQAVIARYSPSPALNGPFDPSQRADGYASPPLSRQTSPSKPLLRHASENNLVALANSAAWTSATTGLRQRGHTRSGSGSSHSSFRASPRTQLLRTVDDMTRELQFTREGMVKLATRLDRLEYGAAQRTTQLWERFEKQIEGTLLMPGTGEPELLEHFEYEGWWQWWRLTKIMWVLAALLLVLLLIEWFAVIVINQFGKRILCLPS